MQSLRCAARGCAIESSPLTLQRRFKGPVARSQQGIPPRIAGQVAAIGRDATRTGQLESLGCVLHRKTHTWDIRKDGSRAVLSTLYNYLKSAYALSDMRRRRDDLELAVMGEIYKSFLEGLYKEDLKLLSRVLSVYEYIHYEQVVNKKKKERYSDIKAMTRKPKVTAEVHSCHLVNCDSLEFEKSEYIQVSVRVAATVHLAYPDGTSEDLPLDEYVVFELSHASEQVEVLNPLKLCGRYDLEGDRIGADAIDPSFYKSQMGSAK
eukprot:TRINITY_DN52676_c0_g1_i1.p1 TRINITY_DN52676_c0_g1~~TRINITY_DN52676_c0_g1_i1.p1  ORF type:complete len:285 (+),score=72.98 TRINITY_DN52676_c0_g1_i1:65-856(+)